MESDDNGTTNYQTYEESLFLNLPNTRDNSLPAANNSAEAGITNDETARLRGNDTARQIGPGKLLEVMPGDVIDMEAYYYYQSGYSDNGAVASGAFLSNLLSLMNGAAQVASESQAVSNAVNGNAAAIFAASNGSASKPRAYLNYILFDRDFGYLDAGYLQVGSTHSVNAALNLSKSIDETGYIYVYVSNESNNAFDVYFDDLRITHQKGRILQEDHYYPFGLSIKALSSSAPLSKHNRFKYSGFEEQTDFDLGWYDYLARQYDPQLGRFTSIDPAADLMRRHSPYNYAFDNPLRYIDPDGMMPSDMIGSGSEKDDFDSGNTLDWLSQGEDEDDRGWWERYTDSFNGDNPCNCLRSGMVERGNGGDNNGNTNGGTSPDPFSLDVGLSSSLTRSLFSDNNSSNGGSKLNILKYAQIAQKPIGSLYSISTALADGFSRASLYYPGYVNPSATTSIRLGGYKVFEINALKAGKYANYAKTAGRFFAGATIIISGVDMAVNGQNLSNSFDMTMGIMAFTGYGTPLALAYFLANGITYFATGEDIGQHTTRFIQNEVNKGLKKGIKKNGFKLPLGGG